jgi:uncharacterized cupin superfamily protein
MSADPQSPFTQFIIRPKHTLSSEVDSDLSRGAGFKKLGIHHVRVPPGQQTSLPHAESLEEEFVFVISGTPHAWVDGFIYELGPGWAAGFPAGTGIAHCFINNTNRDVELLVIGERTKKENLCSFPVDPEQKEKSEIWWADAPRRTLGPHAGRPGALRDEDIGRDVPACLIDSSQLVRSSGWHYPGDSETFSEYARLTDPLGLKVLGVSVETLRPGHRSSFPHAHKKEEELVFILSGAGFIWMNGFLHAVSAGDAAVFPPGTGIAHTVVNDSSADLHYIVVGEAVDLNKEDRVFYPQHPFRNEQCRYQKTYWEDQPAKAKERGVHDGRPALGLTDHLCFAHLPLSDETTLLELFKKSPTYFLNVDGCVPTLKTVQAAMNGRPQKTQDAYRKEFLLILHRDKVVGAVELHIHHPEQGVTYIGLLLLSETEFGKGLGRRAYELTEHYVKTIYATGLMRLGISQGQDAQGFWLKMGFKPSGQSYEWQGESKTTVVLEYDKALRT